MMRRRGMARDRCKLVAFMVRLELMAMVDNDLQFVNGLSESDRRVIQMGCQQLAYAGLKIHNKAAGQLALSTAQLEALHEKLLMIDAVALSLPSTDVASAASPSLLHLDLPTPPQSSAFPLCDRLQRKEDVEGLAGLPVRLPAYVPVDVLQQPPRARDFEEALAAIRHCDRECTRIAVQGHCIKNQPQLIVSIIAHTFTHVVPVPLPQSSPQYAGSVWSTPLPYGLQLDVLILLQRIVEHFAASAFSLQPTRSFDAVRVLVPAVLLSIADVVLRKVATDIPSEVSLNLAGHPLSLPPFGVGLGRFVEQSEAMLLHTPELSVARTSVLDYFASLGVADDRLMFQWERFLAPEQSTGEWMGQICEQLAFPQGDIALYLSGEQHLIIKNYPEFPCYRDVAFFFKLFMNTEVEGFPPVAPWTQKHAGLKWKYDEGVYLVAGFQMELVCKPRKGPFTHRYPSPAVPGLLTTPHPAETEDDVLHIKTLPTFDDSLGQRDSELFLSYLTVPYMRLPLCLTFFATEDRIHALRSEKLREVLDSVLFEPGSYLAVGAATLPTLVPCNNPHLLATPYGHLVNEVYRSPDTTVTCTLRLLRLAQDLDVGTVRSSTVEIILYVVRLACRVENYLSYLVDREGDAHASVMRERRLTGELLRVCEEGLALIRRELRGGVHRMVEAWCDEAMKEIDMSVEANLKRSDDKKMDANTQLACTMHAHLLLVYHNVSARALNENVASQLLSSYIFLTTRHTFNLTLLPVDEHELFECLSVQRRVLVSYLRSCSQGALNRALESAVRTSTGTGVRRAQGGERKWGYVGGVHSGARFAVVSHRKRDERASDDDNAAVQTITATESMGVEIDLSLAQMTLRSSHLKALDTAIASNEDVLEVFGASSMQAATLQSAEHREWVRLVGRSCDLQYWKTPDARPDPQVFDREYQPGELEESEQWIVPLLEPVRLTYMTRPFVLQIVLPELPLSPHAEVAVLIGLHPKRGGNWKAIYVFKSLRTVHVYNVYSHGRRFYQSLEYTTDVRFTLRGMQPSVKDRQNPWPAWERHGAGHPYAEHEDPLSVVILRAADVHENASNTEETFIPSRLLYGIVPSALLDTHRFWQDTHDNLRGYPKDSDGHMLVVELEEKKSDQAALRTAGVVAHIRRLPLVKPGAAPRAQQTEEKEKARYRDEEKTKHRSDEEENGDDVEASPVKQARTLDEEELVLLNLLYAAPDSQLASLARTISRVENLSHVLAWAKASNVRWRGLELEGDVTVELLELPRLKLNFQSRKDEKGVTRLYSLDHVTLFVSNERSALTSKLISGLPHSLLLANANGEVMVLVPSIHPVRPIIGTAPFSTELVLNRVNKEWNTAVQDVRYHLYPVHVSLSFMFTPSLSSALYLLLLRFLHRDYAEVFRLANSIGTDTELSVEERAIFSALKDNADAHPDAHACRLKISLVTADSPMKPGWDVTHTMSRYISKLSHVSAHCRMTHAEELQLTQDCILSLSDPRFDPETMKEFDIVLVGNRASYLTALLAGQTSCAVTVPGRAIGGRWTHHVDLSYVAASPLDWQSLTVQFSASPVLSGVIALETANQFFTGLETMNGSALKLGFLFFYGLLTGTIKMKMAANDDSATFATLLLQLCMDAHDPGLLPSILHVLSRNPALCATLPKYKDARQFKHETINGFSEDGSPSPIDELFSELIPSLQSLAPFLKQPPTSYPRPAPPAARCEVRPLVGREWIIPALSNFAQDERVLRPVDGAALGDDALSLTSAQVDVLVTRPLSELALERYVTFMSRTERGLADVSAQLPFDVGRHPQAQSEVARAMTSRLQDDMRTFAAQENTGKSAKLLHVLDADVAAIVRDPSSPVLATALSHVQLLLTSLQQLRDDDSAYVSNAIPWILSQANAVATEAEASEDDAGSTDRFRFLLRRYAGQESHLWLETIFAALLSSESVADMRKVNPFLDDRALADIFDVAVAVILRANRVGHANRSISDARDLLHLLHQAQHPSASLSSSALTAGLTQKAEMLARNLVTARHYIDRRPSGELVYDPRFLVFEFTWNLCLRKMQVELVRDFMRHVREGRSTVKGMLMGEGKTTVVGPLLALMLADGKRLVISCQPPALLEFSRSIQRSTFSAIMFKRIFTLTLERSSKVDAKLYSKLLNARQTGGIVISTPTAIKSIQLKFIELLAAIEDSTRPRHAQMEVEAAELHRTLRLFQSSVLIMDEVDLILHPLKSELNFPIGAKLDLDFAPHRWKLPIHLLDAVFFASRGRMSVGFHDSNRAHAILAQLAQLIQLGYSTRALQRNPHVVLLNVEFYHEQLKPVLMDWLLLWLESQHLSGLSEEQIKAYILHGSTGDVKLTAAVEALSPKMLKMLNLSRDWLGSYMPHVLSKIDRVSFGLLNADDLRRAKALDAFMPSSRAVLAVPFVGKDVPSRSSEFAHPDIIIGLTILAYRYEGLRESDFHDIIASLRSTLTKEIGPYQSRKSTVRYNRFVTAAGGRIRGQQVYRDEEDEQKATPDGRKQRDRRSSAGADDERVEVVALRLLKRSNEEQMRALYQLLRLLPDLIHWYLLEFIFPAEMRHQVTKLQASGQDLGGEMLFPVRLAFSGTPSTLLPYELGEAHFQPGSDGLIVHTLTDPAIVQCERIVEGWTVTSLLDAIATNPNVHALIDTGALITGMSNLDVARYLLQRGLTDFAGVVFLDELDRKMILVRSTGHVVPLATSGVPPEARFAFYDQIHTTGMDIQHRLNACAVLTLGKDMVFRDYAQGAYRMRGIAKGQTIRLFVIPEIVDLMGRELGAAAAEKARATAAGAKVVVSAGRERAQLEEIAAWLVINSMRSERIQFNALALQNLANVWRKTAFKALMDNVDAFNITEPLSSEQASLRRSLHLFNEPVLFAVESGVKEPRLFSATVQAAVEAHGDYILSEHDRAVVQRVQHAVAGVVDDDLASSFDREMVQEQEAEREQEQEQEQEQEIEIEKYVDLAYSRENEAPVQWPFAALAGDVVSGNALRLPFLYPLRAFKLYKRQPLAFPDYLYLSNNFFNPQWSGARRIKNGIVILELAPSPHLLKPAAASTPTLTARQQIALKKAIDLFHRADSHAEGLVEEEVAQLIRSAMDFTPTGAQVADLMSRLTGGRSLSPTDVLSLLQSGEFRAVEDGRFFVGVSLAEAETIRRIMHMRLDQPVLERSPVALALRCLPSEHVVLDASHGFSPAPAYQASTAQHAFGFFDCNFHFSDAAINTLLRALGDNSTRQRQSFFSHVIGCRRRMTRRWEETPLAKLFTIPDEYHMLKQRAQSVRVRSEIERRGLLQYDFFRSADADRNGLLTGAELWGAMDWLGIPMSADDIVDLLSTFDSDGDRNLSYAEFVALLRDPNSPPEALDAEGDGSSGQQQGAPGGEAALRLLSSRIQPKGEAELSAVMDEIRREEKRVEEEELRAEREEEEQIKREILAEEDEEDRKQEGGPNPQIDADRIRYDFTTGRRPRLLQLKGGDIAYRPDTGGRKYLKVFASTALQLSTPIAALLGEAHRAAQRGQKPSPSAAAHTAYTLTLELRLDGVRSGVHTLVAVGPPNARSRVQLRSDGSVGFDGTFSGAKLRKDHWAVVTISVDCGDKAGHVRCFVDGRPATDVALSKEKTAAAQLALSDSLALFEGKDANDVVDASLRSALLLLHAMDAGEAAALHEAMMAENAWACVVCTSINTADAVRCAVCGSARQLEKEGGGGAAVVDEWECAACTSRNPNSATVCQVCDTSRGA